MKSYQFHDYQTLKSPNIIVDGLGNSFTKLTLSHWPNSGTPEELKADLSTEIVFNYLNKPKFQIDVPYVSNNHFDHDGLTSIYSLVNPKEAMKKKEFLIDIASVGDFQTFKEKNAYRIAFVINNSAENYNPNSDTRNYIRFMKLLPELVSDVEKYEEYWIKDEKEFEKIQSLYKDSTATIEKDYDLDLAVIRIPNDESGIDIKDFYKFTYRLALHNDLDVYRVLLIQKDKYFFYYRYESFVECKSISPAPRKNVRYLVDILNKKERKDNWEYNEDYGYFKNTSSSLISEKNLMSIFREFFISQ